jgi:hypothetical protein
VSGDGLTPAERYLFGMVREDMRSGFDGVHRRLDGMVSAPVFTAHQQATDRRFTGVEEKLAELNAKRDQDARDRTADRRYRLGLVLLVITAIILPIAFELIDLVRAV